MHCVVLIYTPGPVASPFLHLFNLFDPRTSEYCGNGVYVYPIALDFCQNIFIYKSCPGFSPCLQAIIIT